MAITTVDNDEAFRALNGQPEQLELPLPLSPECEAFRAGFQEGQKKLTWAPNRTLYEAMRDYFETPHGNFETPTKEV